MSPRNQRIAGGMPWNPPSGRSGHQASSAEVEDWRDDAACAGMDTRKWYASPDMKTARETPFATEDSMLTPAQRQALFVCFRCPVRSECLSYALAKPERHGIWGGVTERRRTVARAQLKAGIPVQEVTDYLIHDTERWARKVGLSRKEIA